MAFKFVPYTPGGSGGGDNTVIDVESLPTENIDDSKVYRFSETANVCVYVAQRENVLPMHEMIQVPLSNTPTYVVETLPDVMEPINMDSNIVPLYVLSSTGVAYISTDGTSAGAMTLGALFGSYDKGWVDSVDEMTSPDDGRVNVYACRGGWAIIHYGIPNNTNDKVLHEYTSENGWINLKEAFAAEKDALEESLQDEIHALETDKRTLNSEINSLNSEINSLNREISSLTTEKETLVNQNAQLTEQLANPFNIAFGDEEPTDTTKLWLKTTEPSDVVVSPVINEKSVNVVNLGIDNIAPSGCALVNGKIYTYKDGSCYCFDPSDSCITELDAVVYEGHWVAVGQKIYMFGGSVRCLDIETMSTEDVSLTYPSASYANQGYWQAPVPIAVGTKIYLFGGYTANGWQRIVWCLDTETNVMTSLDRGLPLTNKTCERAAVVGTKIYMRVDSGIYCLDTETDTWSERLCDHYQHSCPCAAIGTDVYWFRTTNNTILKFDTTTNTLETIDADLNTSTLNSNANAVSVSDSIYLFGVGETIQRFYPDGVTVMVLEKDVIQIIPTVEKNLFRLTNDYTKTVEIGVDSIYKGDAGGNGKPFTAAALYKDGAWVELT